jgi:hypothetical protein
MEAICEDITGERQDGVAKGIFEYLKEKSK